MMVVLHQTCPTDADIGGFDLGILLSLPAHGLRHSSGNAPSLGLFHTVE